MKTKMGVPSYFCCLCCCPVALFAFFKRILVRRELHYPPRHCNDCLYTHFRFREATEQAYYDLLQRNKREWAIFTERQRERKEIEQHQKVMSAVQRFKESTGYVSGPPKPQTMEELDPSPRSVPKIRSVPKPVSS